MRIKYTILLFICGILFASCADRATQARLERADSLMWSAPDSAYRILQAINRDSLSTNGQRAYYGLLYTQAQYKNYVPLTSDSLILRSVLYYEGRDNYKYGLSLYYLGAVYQDKEFYNLAIEQYKRALKYVDHKEYTLIAALLHRHIGTIYRKQYFPAEAIDQYRKAEQFYKVLNDSSRLSFLYDDIGVACRMMEQNDSAIYYSHLSLDLSRQLKDSVQMGLVQNSIAWLCQEQGRLIEAKQWLQNSVELNADNKPTSHQWILMARIAFAEGKMDSALYCLIQKPSHSLSEDKLRSEVYYAQGRYDLAYDAFQEYFLKVSDNWGRRNKIRVDEIATQYDYTEISEKNKALSRNLVVWVVWGLLSLLLVGVLAILFVTRHRQHLMEAQRLNEALRGLRQTVSEDHSKLRNLIEGRVSQFATLVELSSIHKENDKVFAKKVRSMIEQNPLGGQDAREILHTVNQTSCGLIDYLTITYPDMNSSELLICALTYLGYDSHQLYAILSARSVKTIYDKRHKIVRKMQERGDLKNILDRIVSDLSNNKTTP